MELVGTIGAPELVCNGTADDVFNTDEMILPVVSACREINILGILVEHRHISIERINAITAIIVIPGIRPLDKESVVARTTIFKVVAFTAGDDIIAVTAIDIVSACPAIDHIIASATGNDIVVRISSQRVIEGRTRQIFSAGQRITFRIATMACARGQAHLNASRGCRVISSVSTIAADERISASAADENVIALAAVENIGARIASQHVVEGRACEIFN